MEILRKVTVPSGSVYIYDPLHPVDGSVLRIEFAILESWGDASEYLRELSVPNSIQLSLKCEHAESIAISVHISQCKPPSCNTPSTPFDSQNYKAIYDLVRKHTFVRPQSNGVRLIEAERDRQIEELGCTAEKDDCYEDSQLINAAMCYVAGNKTGNTGFRGPRIWPWGHKYWKPGTEIRNLTKAGALIAAEIDRLTRLEAKEASNG